MGWHVIKKRDYDIKDTTRAQRDAAEKDFFNKRVWSTALPKTQLGVGTLRPRLSRVLLAQITAELPNLVQDVDRELQGCKNRLAALGGPRGTLTEQKMYLLKASQTFATLLKAAIEGSYTDAFFGTSETKEGSTKRLRAVVQSTMTDFARTMAQEGHAVHIAESKTARTLANKGGPLSVPRDKYLESVTKRMRSNRGRELPGLFNPSIVGDLFFDQAKPWGDILQDTQEGLVTAAKATVNLVLDSAADAMTKDGIMRYIIRPNIEHITENLQKKRQEEI